MNASVSIDKVIWIIVTGPFQHCTRFVIGCDADQHLELAYTRHYAMLSHKTCTMQIRQTNASFVRRSGSARQDAGCPLGFVI